MYPPDLARVVVLFVMMLAVALFPLAAFRQGRHWSAWLAVFGCEILLVAGMLGIISFWGEPLVLSRTPLFGLGAYFIAWFSVYVLVTNKRPF